MSNLTKTDIKRLRKALKIADRANDYNVIQWTLGEVEAVLDNVEAKMERASK